VARKVYLFDSGGRAALAKSIGLGLLNLIYAAIGGATVFWLAGPADRGRRSEDETQRPRGA